MKKIRTKTRAVAFLFLSLILSLFLGAHTAVAKTGIVIMHGKASSPDAFVAPLADFMKNKEVSVANLDMPWSKKRHYDVPVSEAVNEVKEALKKLKDSGANNLFIAGHSQGAVFTVYLATLLNVNGIILIAPGGDSANEVMTQNTGNSYRHAKDLAKEGKGDEKTTFVDFEKSKGTFNVDSTPNIYLTWFDPEGAMNQFQSAKKIKKETPVLFVSPINDYPALSKVSSAFSKTLPENSLTRTISPDSDHKNAPKAAAESIFKWINEVIETSKK